MKQANVPQPRSIRDEIAINQELRDEKKFQDEQAEKAELKAKEDRDRDFLISETNAIKDIIEKEKKNVTGQIEGSKTYRAIMRTLGIGKESEKLRRRLERYANRFTLENVGKLKGPLSEKELGFVQKTPPKWKTIQTYG